MEWTPSQPTKTLMWLCDNKKVNLIDPTENLPSCCEDKPTYDQLLTFKSYWDELYGQGLEIANWHLNGNTEPYDSFYESALDEAKLRGCPKPTSEVDKT